MIQLFKVVIVWTALAGLASGLEFQEGDLGEWGGFEHSSALNATPTSVDEAHETSSPGETSKMDGISGQRVAGEWIRAPAAGWTGRSGHTSLSFNNKMWVLGGHTGSVYYNEVWWSSDGVSWGSYTAQWSPRAGHGSAVYSGRMWVIGGWSGRTPNYGDMWYSFEGRTWTLVANSFAWNGRSYHGMTFHANNIWMTGGWVGVLVNDVWYSVGSGWGHIPTSGPIWSPRHAHASVSFNGLLWVIGGSRNGQYLSDVWYSGNIENWAQTTDTPGWAGRHGLTAVVYDNRIWVLGGWGGGTSYFNDVWYTSDGISWTKSLAPSRWSGRQGHTSIVFDNKIWVLGGKNGGYLNDVWYFDLFAPTSSPTRSPTARPSLSPTRSPTETPTLSPTGYSSLEDSILCEFAAATNITQQPEISGWDCAFVSSDKCVDGLWTGIRCTDDTVHELLLDGHGISGTLPEMLFKLTKLSSLYLNDNSFHGTIPRSIGNLRNLNRLRLQSNGLVGSVPDSVGSLVALQELQLQDNFLQAIYPRSLCDLSNLTVFYVSQDSTHECLVPTQAPTSLPTDTPTAVPSTYDSFENIAICDLINATNIAGILGWSCENVDSKCEGWTGLYCDSNNGPVTSISVIGEKISGSLPSSLQNMKYLTHLNLRSNYLTGSIPIELGKLTGLELLTLRNNLLTGSVPEAFADLNELRVLRLEGNYLNNQYPRGLCDLPDLTEFYLTQNIIHECLLPTQVPTESPTPFPTLSQLPTAYPSQSPSLSIEPTITPLDSWIGDVVTIAGSRLSAVNDGVGTFASFQFPSHVVVSSDNSFLVVCEKQAIRKIVLSTSEVSTIAKFHNVSDVNVESNRFDANFSLSLALSPDSSYGVLTDRNSGVIKLLQLESGDIITLLGSGVSENADSMRTNFSLVYPNSVAMSSNGSFALIGDSGNCGILMYVFSTDQVSTLSGGTCGSSDGIDTAAQYQIPFVSFISRDNDFAIIVDAGNHIVQKLVISTGSVTTIAGVIGQKGFVDGVGSHCRFFSPTSAAMTKEGNFVLISDFGNNAIRIMSIATYEVSTIAGSESSGWLDGLGPIASFNGPSCVSLSSDGSVAFVTDSFNHVIRKLAIKSEEPAISTTTLVSVDVDAPCAARISGHVVGGVIIAILVIFVDYLLRVSHTGPKLSMWSYLFLWRVLVFEVFDMILCLINLLLSIHNKMDTVIYAQACFANILPLLYCVSVKSSYTFSPMWIFRDGYSLEQWWSVVQGILDDNKKESVMRKLKIATDGDLQNSLQDFLKKVEGRHESLSVPMFFAFISDLFDVVVVLYNYTKFCESSEKNFWRDLVTLVSLVAVCCNVSDIFVYCQKQTEIEDLEKKMHNLKSAKICPSANSLPAPNSVPREQPIESYNLRTFASRPPFVCVDEIVEHTYGLAHWYMHHRNDGERWIARNGRPHVRGIACALCFQVGGDLISSSRDKKPVRCALDLAASRIKQLNMLICNGTRLIDGRSAGRSPQEQDEEEEGILQLIYELFVAVYIQSMSDKNAASTNSAGFDIMQRFEYLLNTWKDTNGGNMYSEIASLRDSELWSTEAKHILLEEELNDSICLECCAIPEAWRDDILIYLQNHALWSVSKSRSATHTGESRHVAYALKLAESMGIYFERHLGCYFRSKELVLSRVTGVSNGLLSSQLPNSGLHVLELSHVGVQVESTGTMLGADASLEPSCVIECVTPVHTKSVYFPFISRIIKSIKEVYDVSLIVPCALVGYCSYRFFLCALHIGQPSTTYNKHFVLIIMLAVLVVSLVPTCLYNNYNYVATGTIVLTFCMGGAFALLDLESSLDAETYLGLGPQYNLADRPIQAHLVPLLYGVMHVCLVLFMLLPLTMCRQLINFVTQCDAFYFAGRAVLVRMFGLHRLYAIHRFLGYSLCCGLYIGAALWWVAMYYSCAHYGKNSECRTFLPEGSFIDIRGPLWFCSPEDIDASVSKFRRDIYKYDSCLFDQSGNPGAVFFLRIVIVSTLLLMLLSSSLKYPLLKLKQADNFIFNNKIWTDWIVPNSFELFLYTHIVGANAIAFGAFFSRFEVFYSGFLFWVIYGTDKLLSWLRIHRVRKENIYALNMDTCAKTSVIKLNLRTGGGFSFEAGQILYLRCTQLSYFQWHPFSISSKADNDELKLLIKVENGGWTERLKHLLIAQAVDCLDIMGPFSSSFQNWLGYDCVMLVGTGTGIAGALSIIDDIKAKSELRANSQLRHDVKVWLIWSTAHMHEVTWAMDELFTAITSKSMTRIKAAIHVTRDFDKDLAAVMANLDTYTGGDEELQRINESKRFVSRLLRKGRPIWGTYMHSFAAMCSTQSFTKAKLCVCSNRSAIVTEINEALANVDLPPNIDVEFTSEDFA